MRFNYVRYDAVSAEKQEKIKAAFQAAESLVETQLQEGREKALVMTYLEIAYMWTGKAIRDEQISRGSFPDHVPNRSNE